ncbi:MAG: HAD-IIIC family phosphatase [Bacteroidota bacterium]|nr:HAD-IIIC family phosphatase [Bacteroidota bacterium]
MFESEIYSKSSKGNLPEDITKCFQETQKAILKKSILNWTEHCTECAMPACFKTCSLYSPRIDGKCQRFVHGIEPIKIQDNSGFRILKISFKKWAMLSTQGSMMLEEHSKANNLQLNDLKVAKRINLIPHRTLRKKFIQKRYSIKKNYLKQNTISTGESPDSFIIEIYNPQKSSIFFTLTIRSEDEKYSLIPFQYKVEAKQGYCRELIPFEEIKKRLYLKSSFRIDITPENVTEDDILYFGELGFVDLKRQEDSSISKHKIKCIVWDLDNTIWNGTLVEDGAENLKLKDGIEEVLEKLDQGGIINSVASKNNLEEALSTLKKFKIDKYFIFPKIHWGPKSQSIKELSEDLNFSINTFLFIDDSPFEREEVQNAIPEIRVLDAVAYRDILELDELVLKNTEESKQRRKFYLDEKERKSSSERFKGDYINFLRSCDIQLRIFDLEPENFERVYELTQRTNQMNFSGNVYSKEELEEISKHGGYEKYVMHCRDKFGDYGIIGFALIEKAMDRNTLVDLMFSCRIQSKRVEHAFIQHCLDKYLPRGTFYVKYKRSDRNKYSAQVFDDLGFHLDKKEGSLYFLSMNQGDYTKKEEIVTIIN